MRLLTPPTTSSPVRRPPVILLTLFALLAAVMIFSQRVPSRVAYDQKLYHLPSVEQFAKALPSFDPWDYLSATTPGYHLLYAIASRATGGSLLALQLLSTIIAGGFFWLLATLVTQALTRSATVAPGSPTASSPRSLARLVACSLALCLPLLTSPYTLYPAVFILPDMLGWLCVLALLAIALRDRITLPLLALASAVLVVLVLTRQIHIWVAGPLVLACMLQSPLGTESTPTLRSLARLFTLTLARSLLSPRVLAYAALLTLPAVITLALFIRYWGGLVPPRFQGWYPTRTLLDMALSPAPAFFLTMTGIYGCFFAGYLLEPARALWQRHRAWLIFALVLGALFAIVPVTTYDYEAGRRTGIWNIAARLPVIAGHTSPLLLVGSIWGALVFAALISAQSLRTGLILLCTAAAYCAAMSASQETWQRYFDPMVLILLALLCAGAMITPAQHAPRLERTARIAGPAVLALLLLVQSTLPFTRADVTTMQAPPPPAKSENHQGAEPPVLFAPPIKPANRVFWPL
jgi:hypothetical protein